MAIHINSQDLIEMLRHTEIPFATWENSPELAGSYCYLPTRDLLPPSRHLCGEPEGEYLQENLKTPILGCAGCGICQCWPMLVNIELGENKITWNQFEQPYRPKWKYSELEFCFDRKQYEAALEVACRELNDRR